MIIQCMSFQYVNALGLLTQHPVMDKIVRFILNLTIHVVLSDYPRHALPNLDYTICFPQVGKRSVGASINTMLLFYN